MASGSFNITRTSGSTYNTYRVVWKSTPYTDGNYSLLDIEVYVDKSSASTAATYGTATTSATVGKTTQTQSQKFNVAPGASEKLFSKGGYKVQHNEDGSGSATISVTVGGASSETNVGASGSKTVTLDTIARASVPTMSATDFTVGNQVYVNSNRKSTSFTHLLYLKRNDGLYYNSVSPEFTDKFDINTDTIKDIIYSQCTASKEWDSEFLLRTLNGTETIGDKTCSFKARIPENADTKPTATMDVSPVAIADWIETDYVQGKSQVQVTMTATPKHHAGVRSFNVDVGGSGAGASTSATSAALMITPNKSGEVEVKGTVYDTRGIPSETLTEKINIIPYSKPVLRKNSTFGSIVCERYDEEKGEISDSGTSLKLIIGADWYSLSQKENTAAVEVQCVSSDSVSAWVPVEATEQGGGAENNYKSTYEINAVISDITLDVKKTYVVTVRCIDKFGEYDDIDFKIPTEDVAFHLGKFGTKAAFGKYAERDKAVEIAEDWDLIIKNKTLNEYINSLPQVRTIAGTIVKTFNGTTVDLFTDAEIKQRFIDKYGFVSDTFVYYNMGISLTNGDGGSGAIPNVVHGRWKNMTDDPHVLEAVLNSSWDKSYRINYIFTIYY